MGRNGINEGLKPGWHQGSKTGLGHSRMESGFKKGIVNEAGIHSKVQDPTILQGSKKPTVFWLADYATATTAGSTITALTNLINGGTTMLIGSSPAWQPPYRGDGGVYNNRAYIDFNSGSDRVYTNSATLGSGKNELTIMMVFNISSATDNRVLFYSVDSTISSTVGDITVETMGGNRVRVTVIGSPTSTSAVYETYDATLAGPNWHLLTVKLRLYQPNGPGSELEVWLDGKLNMNPITTTFGGSTSNFVGNTFNFGNNTSATNGASKIAAALTLDYWANPSEQMRLENFFRWYYGRRF